MASGSPHAPQRQPDQHINFGGRRVAVEITYYGESTEGVVAINVHGNESQSVTIAEKIMAERGGTLIRIKSNERHIPGKAGPQNGIVDPNRIWTVDAGPGTSETKIGLQKNAFYDPSKGIVSRPVELSAADAATIIKGGGQLTDIVLKEMAKKTGQNKRALLGLHNNMGGDNINIDTYAAKPKKEVAATHIGGKTIPNDLLFVTDPDTYKRLAAYQGTGVDANPTRINALLQGTERNPDGTATFKHDGSASQWAIYQKVEVNGKMLPINYVNSEAVFKDVKTQESQMRAVLDVFEAQKLAAQPVPTKPSPNGPMSQNGKPGYSQIVPPVNNPPPAAAPAAPADPPPADAAQSYDRSNTIKEVIALSLGAMPPLSGLGAVVRLMKNNPSPPTQGAVEAPPPAAAPQSASPPAAAPGTPAPPAKSKPVLRIQLP